MLEQRTYNALLLILQTNVTSGNDVNGVMRLQKKKRLQHGTRAYDDIPSSAEEGIEMMQ